MFAAPAANVRAGDTIVVPAGRFQVDHVLHLIVTDLSVDMVNAQWPGQKSTIQADGLYGFVPNAADVMIGTAFPVVDTNGTAYQLYFTDLPLLGITTEDPIVDEPQVAGHLVLSDGSGQLISADLGIEFRGGSSQSWPKKSYRIEFRSDTAWEEQTDVQLLSMRSDDDWNLLALYNEPFRLRNVVCNRLWRMIHEPYYQSLEPEAVNGVRMKHAELFINGAYQGLYAVSERIDRKQLKLKSYNGTIRGELYKGISWGASTFSEAPPYSNSQPVWSGFEYDYPDEVIDWASLHDLVEFVLDAQEADFLAGYPSRFELGNAVDYFIFLNLLRATDNFGKNIYIARYDSGTPYFYVPFDLDGTFGIVWDGSQENITDDLLLNGLYERLMHDCQPGGFTDRLRLRWNELRGTVITENNVVSLFTQEHDSLEVCGAYAREMLAWPGYVHDPAQLDYLTAWLNARIAFLDIRFNAPCDPIGIEELDDFHISMYPNPASGHFFVDVGASNEPALIKLLDPSGRTVLQQSVHAGHNSMDISRIKSGIYLVEISRSRRISTGRLVIN